MNNDNKSDMTNSNYWSNRWKKFSKKSKKMTKSKYSLLKNILDSATNLNGNMPTVCELGYAPGANILDMASVNSNIDYYGIDYSKLGIEKANVILKKANVKANMYLGDYMTLIPEKLFDMVISKGLIEHAVDPVFAVSRHKTFTRPGGKVVVLIPNYGHPLSQWFAKKIDPKVFESHNLDVMNIKALENIMSKAGLKNIKIIQSGKAKMRSSCPEHTFSRQFWRTLAKLWNVGVRIMPQGLPWYITLGAIGDVPIQTD